MHAAEGRFKDAEKMCRDLLNRTPDDAGALLLLGTLLLETGRGPEAVAFLERTPDEDDPYRHFLLGKACLLSRRLDAAVAAYGAALAVKPDYAEAMGGRGAALAGLRRFAEAVDDFSRALELDPDSLQAQSGLGHALAGLGRSEEAVAAYTRALTLSPDSPDLRARLAALLVDVGRAGDGLAEADRALALMPDSTLIRAVRALALLALERTDEGLEAMRETTGAHPDAADLLRLAAAQHAAGRLDEAEENCRRALAVAPIEMDPHGETMSAHPIHATLGLLLLTRGRFAEGWDHYRQRLENPMTPLPEDLSGETVVINGEDEIGDAVFFLRALPALKARGARVLVRCRPELAGPIGRAEGVDGVVASEEGTRGWHVAAADLPWALDLPDPLPSARIAPLPERTAAMAERLAAFGPSPCLAVSWRLGMPAHVIPLEEIGRALADRDIRVAVPQSDLSDEERARLVAALGRPVLDCSDMAGDVEDLLALLSLVDGIVAVGGPAIHLRAAVGGGGHILASRSPDFRWMEKGERSPWFPTMALHRQDSRGRWDAAAKTLGEALDAARFDPSRSR